MNKEQLKKIIASKAEQRQLRAEHNKTLSSMEKTREREFAENYVPRLSIARQLWNKQIIIEKDDNS
tara:strand:- start:345 stop:542 length:198 start_codon:yes stop_codon:yes gene_type:complete